MSDNLYNKILEQLKKVNPAPPSSQLLTEKIMANLDAVEKQKGIRLQLKASQKQWLLFNGFRIATTAAALLLLVFFVYEQRMITLKLNRLETQVAKSVPEESYNINTIYGVSNVMDLLHNTNFGDSQQNEVVYINRRSLDYLLQKIKQLENENTGFRERLNQLYFESESQEKPNL